MELSTLIPPVAGGIIGYSTNWLAIKMLFKPHKAHYIGKFRLPFTPGLIPKERHRIAASLGEAVGNNLLTEQVIISELTSPAMIKGLNQYIMTDLLDRDIRLDRMMETVILDKEEFYRQLTNRSLDFIRQQADLGGTIKDFITAKLTTAVRQPISINEWIGTEMSSRLGQLVDNHQTEINQAVLDFMDSERVEKAAIELINRTIAAKLGGFAAMLVDGNSIYRTLKQSLHQYLMEEPEHQNRLADELKYLLSLGGQKTMTDFLSLAELEDMISQVADKSEKVATDFLDSDYLQERVRQIFHQLVERPIRLSPGVKQQIERNIEQLYIRFMNKRLPIFLKELNLQTVVTNRINNYSIQEVENLIFSIVDKELNAITNLGAVIGFGIGILTLLI